jgi:uncharacterized phage protein gp47/JayE
MSLETPTTKQISDNIIAQLQSTLNQSIPLLPKSFLRVLSKTLAGVFILLYKYAGFTFLQMFVSTASNQSTQVLGKNVVPLVEWGRLIGIGDPIQATNAELQIEITVTNQTGSISSGTPLLGATNGVTYVILTSVALDAPTVTTTVRAIEDPSGGGGAGVVGNLAPGSIVSFVNTLPNVNSDTTVLSQVVTGAEGESTEAYRQRIVDRFRAIPQGGAYADYRQWGLEVAGIANIFPYTGASPGEVDVYVLATVESSGDPDGIPTGAQLLDVFNSIELDQNGLATRRPANAFVNSLPITRKGFDVEVDNLVVDDPVSVQAEIVTAVTNFLFNRAPFIEGLDTAPANNRVSRNQLLSLVGDIVDSEGGTFDDLILKDGGVPITLYVLGDGGNPLGELAKADSVTFI